MTLTVEYSEMTATNVEHFKITATTSANWVIPARTQEEYKQKKKFSPRPHAHSHAFRHIRTLIYLTVSTHPYLHLWFGIPCHSKPGVTNICFTNIFASFSFLCLFEFDIYRTFAKMQKKMQYVAPESCNSPKAKQQSLLACTVSPWKIRSWNWNESK